jgi:hypothetical protein
MAMLLVFDYVLFLAKQYQYESKRMARQNVTVHQKKK